MKRALITLLCATAALAVRGIDVTEAQSNIDWKAVAHDHREFAYISATRSNSHVNPFFNQQLEGATRRHLILGSVHSAEPNSSSGAEQATFFLCNGGKWINDGRTLPGAVRFENGPNGDTCWGLGPDAMSAWVADFSITYKTSTGRLPVIFTSSDWWNRCTGNNATFTDHALWIADYHEMSDPLPGGWTYYRIWQSKRDAGNGMGASDIWNGEYVDLMAFVKDPHLPSVAAPPATE